MKISEKQRFRDPKYIRYIKTLPCAVCGDFPVDPCHIRSRGSGGGDYKWNLWPGCRKHHSESHQIGIFTFMKKYLKFHIYLLSKGWNVIAVGDAQKLYHPEERQQTNSEDI